MNHEFIVKILQLAEAYDLYAELYWVTKEDDDMPDLILEGPIAIG